MPYKDPEVNKEKAKERSAKWQKENREQTNKKSREWRYANPKYSLLAGAKARSKNCNVEFSIVMENIPETPEICPIAKIPIFPKTDGTKGPSDNSPTLDRVDPSKGYVKGNLRVISHRGNRWKGEMTIENVKDVLSYMLEGTTVDDYVRFIRNEG